MYIPWGNTFSLVKAIFQGQGQISRSQFSKKYPKRILILLARSVVIYHTKKFYSKEFQRILKLQKITRFPI